MEQYTFQMNNIVYDENDPADYFYIIKSGEFMVCRRKKYKYFKIKYRTFSKKIFHILKGDKDCKNTKGANKAGCSIGLENSWKRGGLHRL